ncbi:MAG TPA: SusD/RagB family nutrient-binding outer membrane lipoprotein [Longimicrobiales bacterium]|nr:SusD/RagB family nutrient-binding outer membrane lipoprotein [Longimicrobiales bacterium]
MRKTMTTRNGLRTVTVWVLAAALGACGDGLTDLNINPNEPVGVGAEFLLPSAIVSGAERLHGSTLNMDMVGLWVQHYAEHRYTIEDRFEITDGAVSGHWTNLYAGPLRNLYEVVEKGKETDRANVVAVGTILQGWLFQAVTDLWGDAGYSQALLGRDSPPDMAVAYDTQEAIYGGLLASLEAAVAMISPAGPTISQGDLIYQGNMDQWRKFANSLRLRVAIRLSEVDAATASSAFASALSAGVFTSSADDAMVRFVDNGVDVHPIFGYERNRDDHSISATLVDTLKSLSDPRLSIYARPNQAGEYVGTKNGDQTDPPLTQVSRIGTYFSSAATPAIIMSFAEVLFLQAEAAERGWIPGDAAELYRQAITAAMGQLGVSAGDIEAYLAQSRVQYQGGQAGREQIWLQKWLALFGNGPEAYAEWRRTGIPRLRAGPDALNGGLIPVRLPYPDRERSLNREAVEAAIARQDGATLSSPVWWDVH